MQATKEMIEAAARAIHAYRSSALWQEITGQWQEHCRGEAKAGLDAALSAMWQPIETAPTDGTPFLAFMVTKRICLVERSLECDDPKFWFDSMDGAMHPTRTLTHWMPLPPTPEMK